MSPLRFEEFRPGPELAPMVHRAWAVSTHAPVDDFLVVPDGCLDVLYSRRLGLQVVGTMTAAAVTDLPAGVDVAGVRLRPGAAALWLRTNVAELTDDQLPLGDVLGPRSAAMEDRLRDIDDPRALARALSREVATGLSSAWRGATPRDHAFHRALATLARAGGDISIEWLALQCNLGTRQFHRRCLMATGLPPKRLARVFRLMRVLRLRQRSGDNWTGIAADCGYADQAHFIRDFTDLVGSSPGQYATRRGDVRFRQVEAPHPSLEFEPA